MDLLLQLIKKMTLKMIKTLQKTTKIKQKVLIQIRIKRMIRLILTNRTFQIQRRKMSFQFLIHKIQIRRLQKLLIHLRNV